LLGVVFISEVFHALVFCFDDSVQCTSAHIA